MGGAHGFAQLQQQVLAGDDRSLQRAHGWRTSRSPVMSDTLLTLVSVMATRISFSNSSDRKSTRLNSSHLVISYAVFCLKKKNKKTRHRVLESHSRDYS